MAESPFGSSRGHGYVILNPVGPRIQGPIINRDRPFDRFGGTCLFLPPLKVPFVRTRWPRDGGWGLRLLCIPPRISSYGLVFVRFLLARIWGTSAQTCKSAPVLRPQIGATSCSQPHGYLHNRRSILYDCILDARPTLSING